jgi:ribosome maturation factor RimP
LFEEAPLGLFRFLGRSGDRTDKVRLRSGDGSTSRPGWQEVGLVAHFSFWDVMADRQELLELLEPEIGSLGYELVDLELRLGESGVVRLFIDSEDGITVEDCARVSHQVSGVLEVEDPISGHYVLEVSSPGVNRRLRTKAHFEKFIGQRIKIERQKPDDNGRRRYAGTLRDVGENGVAIEVNEKTFCISFHDIDVARLAPRIEV